MKDAIRIRGAREHNLKGVHLDLPRRSLTVITGPSGSGKSSLAFDTIYAEGQRRYVESLSTYAKQFLERMPKPAVDSVDGLSPTVAIEQKNPTKTSRSTVGTATEVYDHLRLLFARAGRTLCPTCGREVRPDTVETAADRIQALPRGTRLWITFPLRLSERVTHDQVVESLLALGFVRVLADGRERHLADAEGGAATGDLTEAQELLIVVDRWVVGRGSRARLPDSLGTAFAEGEGEAVVVVDDPAEGVPARLAFTERFRCPTCNGEFPRPSPALFSFNHPVGACGRCNGFGAVLEYDADLIVPEPARTLADGAVDPWTKPRYERRRERLRRLAREHGVSMDVPWTDLPEPFRELVLHGPRGGRGRFEGVLPHLERLKEKRYKQYVRVFLRQYQSARVCPECGGTRLKAAALNVRVAGSTIAEVAALPIGTVRRWLDELSL
ncbi:MAG: excinuclease ABC subunit UvrA, partial [Gemmatimonadota bacterium]